jgi:hypothetical protein
MPGLKIGIAQQHSWPLEEGRRSTGTGYYFQVTNLSESETLESVRAQIMSIEPNEVKTLTFPLPMHIRDLDYKTAETSLNPKAIIGFDIATGPDRGVSSQKQLLIPCVAGGDRGWTPAVPIPTAGHYRMKVIVSANNCPAEDTELDIWIENDLLRCVSRRISGVEVL